ncbi:hypothetical protein CCR75_007114 [Bremia lactucae]|uniref:Uncharacterized protein n=1 Tax=Bremia lactucae TaxID=4779 RepID=A0A976IK93_BRELC|nr:hypothetical protein CCR75_007114 [Bremia lactucae]
MELKAENTKLSEALRALQERYDRLDEYTAKKIQDLTDENEILAEANRLLLEKAEQRVSPSINEELALHQVPDELLLPGQALKICELAALDNVHTFGNLLSVSIHVARPEIIITGGADKYVCVHNWKTGKKLCVAETSAPVLALAFNPKSKFADYFVAAGMDAKHAVYKLKQEGEFWSVHTVCEFQDHSRQGSFNLAWSTSGLLFATGASDKSLNIYQCFHLGRSDEQVEKVKSFYFNGSVEAIVFASTSTFREADASDDELLVVAVRDDCYVHYVDCSTFEKKRINMNPDGIEHVSYTILNLSLSPSGMFLLAATDSDRIFIFSLRHKVALRNFYGHKAGPYSQPRAVWHPSEKYIISNNEEDGTIFVWSVASEKIVETLYAHNALVRDLVCTGPASSVKLITVSYDKRIKVWKL